MILLILEFCSWEGVAYHGGSVHYDVYPTVRECITACKDKMGEGSDIYMYNTGAGHCYCKDLSLVNQASNWNHNDGIAGVLTCSGKKKKTYPDSINVS